jgi:small subunit ribosomal protein S13
MAEKKPKIAKGTKEIIRLVETNVDGGKPVFTAIRKIRGVGPMFGNAVSQITGLGEKKVGSLSQEEMNRLEDVIVNPQKHNVPGWMYNRRRDPRDNNPKHIVASNLEFANRMDINELKKLKVYKGVRHSLGLPVRGQRTRGSFRKGKTVGVSKKKAAGGKK